MVDGHYGSYLSVATSNYVIGISGDVIIDDVIGISGDVIIDDVIG